MTAVAEETTAPETPAPGTEVAVRPPARSSLPAKVAYARELANSGLLPAQYRKQPGNILWAIEYGEMLGLSTMAAITGVHVIEGKPTASAGLISALVRRAGHKLRVFGDNKSATCQIVRSDDPDFTFEVKWTLNKNADDNPSAEVAGLLGKKVWREYPASMLKSRAITQCARDACEEALFGLHYTPEELGADVDGDGDVLGGFIMDEPAANDAAWIAASLRIIPSIGLDACRKLWLETKEKFRAGELDVDGQARVLVPLQARMEELAPPAPPATAPGEVQDAEVIHDAEVVEDSPALDPEDPWAIAIAGLADGDSDGATRLLDDAGEQLGSGAMDAERFAPIEAAVLKRFPGIQNAPAVAA
jgi:hypothetical protein